MDLVILTDYGNKKLNGRFIAKKEEILFRATYRLHRPNSNVSDPGYADD